jgi:hypothetical protein
MKTPFPGIPARGFTVRALAIGAVLSVFLNLACPYVVLVMQVAGLTSDYITAGAMMLLFLLVAVVNPVLKLVLRRWALSSTELILIYIMMIVASAIPTWGLVTNLFHILTRPFYYATPENGWTEMILPHIPGWVAPRDPDVAYYFYNGLPRGESIPWRAWVMPLFWWITLMGATYFVMICLMVMVRRQWVEHERLTFPLTHPPMELLRGNDDQVFPPLFKTARFWIPFALVFLLVSQNPIRFRYPDVPEIFSLMNWYDFFNRRIWICFFWNFAIIGVTYFINLDVAASIWVFCLLSKIQTGIFTTVGFELGGRHEWLTGSSPATAHQGFGALIILSAVVLWRGRDHLRAVFRKAFRGDKDVDDSDEVLSYRTAVFGAILGVIFICGWYHAAGMSWTAAIIFLAVANLIFFGLTRVIAVGGIGFTSAPMLPQVFMVYGLGTEFLGPKALTQMAFQYSWAAEYRTSVMTSSIHGMKLVQGERTHLRRVFLGMLIAMLAGLAGAIWITMHLNYTRGGANMRQFGVPTLAYQFTEYHMKNPPEAGWIAWRWLFTGIGALVMSVLVFLRHHFAWWPLHYIGFVVADTWVMGVAWWSVFLGWLAKLIIMRAGGAIAYRRFMPIFLGLIFGQLLCGGFWMAWDFFRDIIKDFVYIGVP